MASEIFVENASVSKDGCCNVPVLLGDWKTFRSLIRVGRRSVCCDGGGGSGLQGLKGKTMAQSGTVLGLRSSKARP